MTLRIFGWGEDVVVRKIKSPSSLPTVSPSTLACLCDDEAIVVVGDDDVEESVQRYEQVAIYNQSSGPLSTALRILSQQQQHRVKLISCNGERTTMVTQSDEIYICSLADPQMLTRLEPPDWISKDSIGDCSKISSGHSHTLLLFSSGRVYSHFGESEVEEVSLPDRAIDVAAGFGFSVIATANRNVYSYGSGLHGRLGLGHSRNMARPTLIQGLQGVGNLVQADQGVTLVSASPFHAVAVTAGPDNTNEVYTWGWGNFGQFGVGREKMLLVPNRVYTEVLCENEVITHVTTGPRHTAVLTARGEVFVFGQLGVPSPDAKDNSSQPCLRYSQGVRHISSFRWGLMCVE